jgi:hypothetical protein
VEAHCAAGCAPQLHRTALAAFRETCSLGLVAGASLVTMVWCGQAESRLSRGTGSSVRQSLPSPRRPDEPCQMLDTAQAAAAEPLTSC